MEVLGLVWALHHFRAYLLGHQCKVYTDHAALKALLKMARWRETVTEYYLDIVYKPGKCNQYADALSCSPVLHQGRVAQVTDTWAGSSDLKALQQADPELACLFAYLE